MKQAEVRHSQKQGNKIETTAHDVAFVTLSSYRILKFIFLFAALSPDQIRQSDETYVSTFGLLGLQLPDWIMFSWGKCGTKFLNTDKWDNWK
eukprot:3655984-Amphidinium_carterae.1